jgi:ATP-binding cassette, subfamily B, bacterial
MADKGFTLTATCKRFMPFLSPQKKRLALILLTSLLASAFAIAAPVPIKLVIDKVLAGNTLGALLTQLTPAGQIAVLAGVSALLAALAALLSALEKTISARAREQLTRDIRLACLNRFLALTPLCTTADRQGELGLRLIDDGQQVARLFTKTGPVILRYVLVFLMALGALAWVNLWFGLLAAGIALFLSIMVRIAARPLSLAARAKRKEEGQVAAGAQEILRLLPFIQASGAEAEIRDGFDRTNQNALATGVAETVAAVRLERIMQIANGMALALVVGVGGYLALRGAVTAGDLAIAIIYLNQMLKPLEKINELASAITGATSRAGRLAELLDRPDPMDRSGTHQVERADGNIALSGVGFAYPGGKPMELGTINLPAGSVIALSGPSGAGKSTFLALLTRLFDPTKGALSLDGLRYPDWRLDSIRSQFALAPQSPPLLAGSVREWLSLGNGTPNDAACEEALAAVALDRMIRLRGGLDTLIHEGGAGFSGGEQARLSLARALLADRPVLLLDEPLANVDQASAAIILAALAREKGQRTIFIISHQPIPADLVDIQLDMRDGVLGMRQGTARVAKC